MVARRWRPNAQLRAEAKFIVGTPGRVRDLLERRVFDTSHVRFAVLDEADEMLSMDFGKTSLLFAKLAASRQTMLFSEPFLVISSEHHISSSRSSAN